MNDNNAKKCGMWQFNSTTTQENPYGNLFFRNCYQCQPRNDAAKAPCCTLMADMMQNEVPRPPCDICTPRTYALVAARPRFLLALVAQR